MNKDQHDEIEQLEAAIEQGIERRHRLIVEILQLVEDESDH